MAKRTIVLTLTDKQKSLLDDAIWHEILGCDGQGYDPDGKWTAIAGLIDAAWEAGEEKPEDLPTRG